MAVLTSQPLKRVFLYETEDGKKIELKDFNPQAPPERIVKFYAGQYPELTNAKIEAPEFKGSTATFKIDTSVGTLG